MTERVFVYGSLKRGLEHHDQLQGAEFESEAALARHCLVHYEESYAALCPSLRETDVVSGEVFLVAESQLPELDAFEDCPNLYRRVRVTLVDGRTAWAYAIREERAQRYRRISGTWKGRW